VQVEGLDSEGALEKSKYSIFAMSSSASIIDSSLQSTILQALSRLSNPSSDPGQIKHEFVDAALRQRCHLPIICSQRRTNENTSPRGFDVDQSWESEAFDPGFARTDVRDKNRARGSSPERSVFSSEQQKLAHHYIKVMTEATRKAFSAIATDTSVSRSVGESNAVQGFSNVLSTLSLASQSALLGPLLPSQVENLKRIRTDIGVLRDLIGGDGILQVRSSSANASSASPAVYNKKRPRSDDTDSSRKHINGGEAETSITSRKGLFEALERGHRRDVSSSFVSSSTDSKLDAFAMTTSPLSQTATQIVSPPLHELRFRCAMVSLIESSKAFLKSLNLWGQTLDRVSEVCGKLNCLEDAFAAEVDILTTRFSSLNSETKSYEDKLQLKNAALMNLLANNSAQSLVTKATEERGEAAAALKMSKDKEAEANFKRAWNKELAELCNAGRNYTLTSSMRAQNSLQRHAAHALFTIDSAIVEFFAAVIELSAAEALRVIEGCDDDTVVSSLVDKADESGGGEILCTILACTEDLSMLIRSLPQEVFNAFTKRADLLQTCTVEPFSSLKEMILSVLDISLTSSFIKMSAQEIAKTSSVESPAWKVLLPPDSTASLADSATTSLFNPPAIRHLKLSTRIASFDLGLVERVVNHVGVQAAFNKAIHILAELVSDCGTGPSLFNTQSVMYPGPIPSLLPSMKLLQQEDASKSKPIQQTGAPYPDSTQKQRLGQMSTVAESSSIAAPSSLFPKTGSRREDYPFQADNFATLQALRGDSSVIISKESRQQSEDLGNEEQRSLKKQRREPQIGNIVARKEESVNILSLPDEVSASVSLKSTSVAEDESGDSESEAACIIF
jgi:hypothetical protein